MTESTTAVPTLPTQIKAKKTKKKKQKAPTATTIGRNSTSVLSDIEPRSTPLSVATWNIAAINNNPFEYWITYGAKGTEKRQYDQLMADMEDFIDNPGRRDVPVSEIFTEAMFVELMEEIQNVRGPRWNSIDFKTKYWQGRDGLNLKRRNIISEFMKDAGIGNKRLTSMPDRVTNVINPEGGGKAKYRPTVISMYSGKNCELNDVATWWAKWKKFMFHTTIPVLDKKTGEVETKIPFSMLLKVSNKKYPDITKAEEKDSLELQTLCCAILDAILVHMMNSVSPSRARGSNWQDIKKQLLTKLCKTKFTRIMNILKSNKYVNSDIITLQEVSAACVHQMTEDDVLGQQFHVVAPGDIDAVRDQNSVILLKKATFTGAITELTPTVKAALKKPKIIKAGDLLVIEATHVDGTAYNVASFHGDTDGTATIPVLKALTKVVNVQRLLVGLDANSYTEPEMDADNNPKQLGVGEFQDACNVKGLQTCWMGLPETTTYNGRTFVQPQLQKAVRKQAFLDQDEGDINPKDYILFGVDHFVPTSGRGGLPCTRDNTGTKKYLDEPYPSFKFPSDHAIVSTVLEPIL